MLITGLWRRVRGSQRGDGDLRLKRVPSRKKLQKLYEKKKK